ncbi:MULTISPECIES: Na/Pi cotransporter family protein [Clostridium]|uniref:Na/Pi cotransporter family protein n=1 Tax=Clostridium TaxID=1485 RepID=UPI00257CF05F|nr:MULTISPECIES: Na/Pi cotransporter family protein [Clostridium]MBS4839688.1 Na/Pi cotransporter family protein [Clostridium sp.]MDU1400838.1 Na/Pi cotransporter family protein [Clostridium sp.]MDU2893683.1 Na/Pi cotransporter family protein [Clostridium sp.]MDU3005458.1 Na/Pi cotransporter family protein [Clostridium sp.]MDU3035609.1 Na/Pi cotransporter family protein [Clostridium sp.]
MTFDDFSMMFQFVGGLGMFLYGMQMMATGLQKTAGDKMKHLLGVLTNNRFMGILVGALITAIIQSSGATTVMVIGFVNAGLMNLFQTVGVIMGANIGTTITAWIVSAGQLGDAFTVMKPSFYAPLMIGIGAMLVMFAKKEKKKNIGEILISLGLLFVGLDWMSGAIKPYTDAPIFAQAFALLGSNPFLGVLVGAIVTAVMQSSSASVGVLQTLAMNGVVTTNAAVYICLGSNIGSCYTALLSSIGASKNSKRAAIINLLFNCFGVLIFALIGFGVFTVNNRIANATIDSVQISIFHTIFNVVNTIIMFPIANLLVKVSCIIVKEGKVENESSELSLENHLDDRIMKTPSFAIEATLKEINEMGILAYENTRLSINAAMYGDYEDIQKVYENEKKINKYEKSIASYLVKINNLSLNDLQHKTVKNLLYTINDLERVGDHAKNIAEFAETMKNDNLKFSDKVISELGRMNEKVLQSLNASLEARKSGNTDLIKDVLKYEDEVDLIEQDIRERYISRLLDEECNIESGVLFMDIIGNLERVSDHAFNIAGYLKDEK